MVDRRLLACFVRECLALDVPNTLSVLAWFAEKRGGVVLNFQTAKAISSPLQNDLLEYCRQRMANCHPSSSSAASLDGLFQHFPPRSLPRQLRLTSRVVVDVSPFLHASK